MGGGLLDDVDDIQVVAEYMKDNYGYDVAMIVAHSKGSIVACKWICSDSKETSKLEMFVNVSGRYRMQVRLVTTLLSSLTHSRHSHSCTGVRKRVEYHFKANRFKYPVRSHEAL
jgi:uncharacterized alpha/beta hydrolase family protein